MRYRLEVGEKITSLFVNDNLTAKYSTPGVAKKFYGHGEIELGILPPVVRYLSDDFLHVIIERPPTVQTIAFKNTIKGKTGKVEMIEVPIPWQVYNISVTKSGDHFQLRRFEIFFRTSQIWTVEDELHPVYLPNVYVWGGKVCTSDEMRGMVTKCDNLADIINTLVEGFWSAEFNLDLYEFVSYLPSDVVKKAKTGMPKEYLDWLSKQDVRDTLNFHYKKVDYKVKHLIDPNCDAKPSDKKQETLPGFFARYLAGNEIDKNTPDEVYDLEAMKQRSLEEARANLRRRPSTGMYTRGRTNPFLVDNATITVSTNTDAAHLYQNVAADIDIDDPIYDEDLEEDTEEYWGEDIDDEDDF